MTTRRLKILIVVMVIILVFILGYNKGHGEDLATELESFTVINTGDVLTGATTVDKVEETIIYTREMTEQRLTEQVDNLIGDYNISYTIVHECASQTKDYELCIKNVVGVSNAESSMFKKGIYPSNNGFGWMQNGKKKKFSSVEESIKQWVALYVKNGRNKRVTGKDWLKGNYCTSECSHRVKNYNSAVSKLELD